MSRRTRIELGDDHGRVVVRLASAQLTPRRLPDVEGRVRVALVATEMLLLAGDDVTISVEVGDGCRLEIVETAGTVAHDMRGRSATWRVDIRLGNDAILLWSGLPFVVADGADVTRVTRVTLDRGAVAVLRETLLLGRTGENGGRLETQMQATQGGGPLLVESFELSPHARHDAALLGGFRCVDSVTTLGSRLLGDGVLQLESEGSVLRWLGRDAHVSPLAGRFHSAATAATRRAPQTVSAGSQT